MADTKQKLINYGIGAIIGLIFYHYVIRKEIPSLPALNSVGSSNSEFGGCSSCGQM